ncbi:SDR family NAD(P)-dependent oxidoreductase [Streptomyces griseoincarnatus]
MAYPTDRPATWFVTGTSRGLGLDLVRQLLERGDAVTATTRSTERLLAALGDGVDTSRLLPLTVDLRDEEQVAAAVRKTTERFGGLDVVVNNAGYGYLAAVEETGGRDVRDMLDVQVVGVWNVLRAALPVLRAQRSGHIVNVSSVLGLTAVPGWALYCAGKFALEGLSEALAAEVADFGIDVRRSSNRATSARTSSPVTPCPCRRPRPGTTRRSARWSPGTWSLRASSSATR